MKKGHIYTIICNDDFENPNSEKYHWFEIGEIVECTDGKSRRFVDDRKMPQYLRLEHIQLIGKI